MPTKPAPLAPGIGRPPKHAGHLLSRVVRKNQLDRRTGVSRLLERVANDLAADRGGWANVSAAEEIAIRRAAFLTVLCSSIETWVLKQPAGVIVDGELLGPLKKGLATHQANLVRTLVALGFRPEKAGKLPTLDEYLTQRRNNGTAGAPAPAPGSATPAAASSAEPASAAVPPHPPTGNNGTSAAPEPAQSPDGATP
jgi:hypothetical protein